jgi:hypothetical protein
MASFIIRLVVSLLLPAWGLMMIVLGVTWGMGWWIATGLVAPAIGVRSVCRRLTRNSLPRRPLGRLSAVRSLDRAIPEMG